MSLLGTHFDAYTFEPGTQRQPLPVSINRRRDP